MLHSGFEVLLGEEGLEALRSALFALLDDAGAARTKRTWTTRKGKAAEAELTDLEWWFTEYTFLRNKIVHGEDLPDDDLVFDGERQFWRAERCLRRALKQTVVNAGFEDVALDAFDRAIKRSGLVEELVADAEVLADSNGPSTESGPIAGDESA